MEQMMEDFEVLTTIICYYCQNFTKRSISQCAYCSYNICRDCLNRIPYCPRCSNKANEWIPIPLLTRDIMDSLFEETEKEAKADIEKSKEIDDSCIEEREERKQQLQQQLQQRLQQKLQQQQQEFEQFQKLQQQQQQQQRVYHKQQHEQQYQQYQKQRELLEPCPLKHYEMCTWLGCTKKDIIRHCDRNHSQYIYHATRRTIRCLAFDVKDSMTKDMCIIFVAYNELFYLYFHGNYLNDLCKWQCCYYGIKKFSKRFHFEVSFRKVYSCNDEISIRAPCKFLMKQQQYQQQYEQELLKLEDQYYKSVIHDHFIALSYSTLREYCHETDLYFSIKLIDTTANINTITNNSHRINNMNQSFNCQRY